MQKINIMTIKEAIVYVFNRMDVSKLSAKSVSEIIRLYNLCDDWNGTDPVVQSYLGWLTRPGSRYYNPIYGRIKEGNKYLYYKVNIVMMNVR